MAVLKIKVPLSAIEQSGQNPRRDFGDIEALADTIRATGGEPVNPIVAVADGNVYRIVDGERRYRALREIYGRREPDREVSVLAYDSMDAANECVAMLATDDKRGLSEEERARGVQQMLVLGVKTERIARASRATRGQVVAARKMADMVPEGRQATLDQMLAASELPNAMAERVLAADDWESEARRCRAEAKAEADDAELRSMLEGAGVALLDGDAVGDSGVPEGHSFAGTVSPGDSDALDRAVAPGAAAGGRAAR